MSHGKILFTFIEKASWTLKPETSASSTSPDTHASPFVYPVIRGGDQHIQHGAVCGAINSASAYWVERIAGHAACSRVPLWQTCTVIPVCKVRRYFNICWSQSDSVLIFIKAIHTCCSVNKWEWMFPRGRELLRNHMLCDSSNVAYVCSTELEMNKQCSILQHGSLHR